MPPRDPVRAARQRLSPLHPADPADLVWARQLLGKPSRLMWLNFLAGLARGLGFALGFTVLAAAALGLSLKLLGRCMDLPFVGQYLAEFIVEVKNNVQEMGKIRP